MDSFQEGEIDFELNAFDDDKQEGSERDVEYMERMMAMLINARGNTQKGFTNFRNGSGDGFGGTETIGATYGGNSSENVLIPGVCSFKKYPISITLIPYTNFRLHIAKETLK